MPNPECQRIVSRYTNSKLTKIVNVYQVQFKDFKAPGFGDYIRGCFCMMQLIRTVNRYCKTNIAFEMDLRNHSMAKYIDVATFDPTIAYANIGNFHIDVLKVPQDESTILFQHILQQSTEYMNKLKMETFYCFCCKYEVFDEILESDKQHIRSFLKPNAYMSEYIDSTLESLDLRQKPYSILHIRCKDELSFPPKAPSESFLKELTDLVHKHIDPEKRYILISNHNGIKYHFLGTPYIKMQLGEICHVGQDLNQTDIQVRDTMLDFFLIAKSAECVAFSPYSHGTGFSEECCKLYNVPHRLVRYRGVLPRSA